MKRDIRVCIGVNPARETEIFRSRTADDILRLLVDAHTEEFTISELVDATGAARSTVWRAVELLNDLHVLRIRETPQRKYVTIDSTALQKEDPVLAIEQPEFHEPIRAFRDEILDIFEATDDVERLVGTVVFGSVARGDADRQSDIDVFVVVDGDRTAARSAVADVVSDLRERQFDGDRYEFEQYVESIDSAIRAGRKLQNIFEEGITIYEAQGFQDVRREVMSRE